MLTKGFARGLLVVSAGAGLAAAVGLVRVMIDDRPALVWGLLMGVGFPVSVLTLLGGLFTYQFAESGAPPPDRGPVSALPRSGWHAAHGVDIDGVPLRASFEPDQPGASSSLRRDATSGPGMHRSVARAMLALSAVELVMGVAFLVAAALRPEEAGVPGMVAGVAITAVGALFAFFGLRRMATARDAERLRTSGIRATATVVALQQTGVTMNDMPLLGIEALVRIPGKDPYRIRTRRYVPLIGLGLVSPGGDVTVVVDPDDADKVLFPWDVA